VEQTTTTTDAIRCFPRTRYQGSKRKLAAAIVRAVDHLEYRTVLDAFGGTGAVAYAFKRRGKAVTYNDFLAFNYQIGLALIENDSAKLEADEIEAIGRRVPGRDYPTFIQDTFEDVYFTHAENAWLDTAATNLRHFDDTYRRALGWFGLCQAALAKRPYNLFHRRNLYMRTADVPRSFGNKATWERPFAEHAAAAVREANAAVLNTGVPCRARCADVMTIEPRYDLVYVDTPYVRRSGVGVDYRDFYHFLEGMLHYDRWAQMVDRSSRHLRLERRADPWSRADTCREAFQALFERFRASTVVVSYRSDGIPSIDELRTWLNTVKRRVRVIEGVTYQYALSKNRDSREALLIGAD